MEGIMNLVALGGDSAIIMGIMGVGYHKLSMRLTAIESHLKAKRENHASSDT